MWFKWVEKSVKRWNEVAHEASLKNNDYECKIVLCVKHQGKVMKNLKQHFYKLKHIETPMIIQ